MLHQVWQFSTGGTSVYYITLKKLGFEKVEEEDCDQPQDNEKGDVSVFAVSHHVFVSRRLAPRPGTGNGPVSLPQPLNPE
jgi:hypothetical protein